MAVTIQTLSRLPLFAGLDTAALSSVVPLVQERAYTPGAVVLLAGEPCQAAYFVVHGAVRTYRTSLEGREHVLAYLGPGESFGLSTAVDGGANPVTVDAVTKTTLYAILCEDFLRILQDHPEVSAAALKRLAGEIRHLSDMVEDLALHTVRGRLARFLLNEAQHPQPAHRWTQEEIAAHIGTAREMVGRNLRTFTSLGLIRRERGRVVVVDREQLEREAQGV